MISISLINIQNYYSGQLFYIFLYIFPIYCCCSALIFEIFTKNFSCKYNIIKTNEYIQYGVNSGIRSFIFM